MIYNTGFRFGKQIPEPDQRDIYEMPEYFALSRTEVEADPKCPDFLKRILDAFPWDGRHNVLQIRPQDFRHGKPPLLGDSWHTDVMVRLNDGKGRVAKDVKEFHLMVCSWGGVVETEFMATPMEMPDIFGPEGRDFGPMQLLQTASRRHHDTVRPAPGQLAEYTSADLHRMGTGHKIGRLRLMIVAFDCDAVESGGLVLPSIREKEQGLGPKFSDYVR